MILCLAPSAFAGQAFITPKWKGIILNAPVPDRLPPLGEQIGGVIYRLTINPQTGGVTAVGVMNRNSNKTADAAMVLSFIKWKFKPGIKQFDVPVNFDVSGVGFEVELKKAVAR